MPLPWCVDRVGAIASNDNNGHEPWPISVTAQTNFSWELSHSSLTTNLPRNASVHESVDVSFPNPPLQFSASLAPSHALPRPPTMSTKDTANELGFMSYQCNS